MKTLTKKRDKLIILGCDKTFKDAPFKDDSFEIWGMNTLWKQFEQVENARADVWWEMHTLHTRKEEQVEWLKNCKIPVVMQDYYPEIPMGIKYPLDEIINEYKRRYFLCTFCYEIALAMYMGYKEIHIYGANMIIDDDYIQRWSVEYWLGRAEQKGIKVVIPDSCDLLKSPKIYGYEADNTLGVYISRYMGELQNDVNAKISDSINNLTDALSKLKTIRNERTKFMEEIFKRHGLNPKVEGNND